MTSIRCEIYNKKVFSFCSDIFQGLKTTRCSKMFELLIFHRFFLVQECKREGNFKFQEGLYEEVSSSIPIGVLIVSDVLDPW